MGRGGARENAGRRKGTLTVRTQETAAQALKEGKTPLEVILANMKFYHEGCEALMRKLIAGVEPEAILQDEPGAPPPDPEKRRTMVDVLAWMLKLREHASKEAERAAPYVHARVAPSEAKDPRDEETVPLSERLAAYEREDAIEASAGKVVPLTKRKKSK